jgi:SNF2 family DNA or RNA helicase
MLPLDMCLALVGTRVKTEPDLGLIQDSLDRNADEHNDPSYMPPDGSSQMSDGENVESPRRRRRPRSPQPPAQSQPGPSNRLANDTGAPDVHTEESVKSAKLRISKMERDLRKLEIDKESVIEELKYDGADLKDKNNLPEPLQEINAKIKEAEDEIKATRKRSLPIMDAREWWQKKYDKALQISPKFNKRKHLGRNSDIPREQKRRKTNSGTSFAIWEDTRKMKKMRINDPFRAIAIMNGDPAPGPMVLNSRGRLDRQLKTFSKLFPRKDDPDLDDPDLKTGMTRSMSEKIKDQRRMLMQAKSSFGFRRCLVVEKGCAPVNAKWISHGIKPALYNHQVIGSSWMVGRELSPYGPHGGILSDEMGLGKTLMVLSCMANNPPSPKDIEAGRKATLIVVPSAALVHWRREIQFKTNFGKACVYRRASKRDIPDDTWKTFPIM